MIASNCTFLIGNRPLSRRGFSLLEVMVVLTMMGILISLSVPSFHRALEQSRADIAGANLRALWSAERLYWLEYRTYTADLSELQSLGLVDPTIVSAATPYLYAIHLADSTAFSATATRTGSERWSGEFAVDATGTVSGEVQAEGVADITPGFQ
jgi:prepilin-type N-terminal cleavage/methylation domain-containing protein